MDKSELPNPTIIEFSPSVKVYVNCKNLPEGVDPYWVDSVGDELEARINNYLESDEGKTAVSDFLDTVFEGVNHDPIDVSNNGPQGDGDPEEAEGGEEE